MSSTLSQPAIYIDQVYISEKALLLVILLLLILILELLIGILYVIQGVKS